MKAYQLTIFQNVIRTRPTRPCSFLSFGALLSGTVQGPAALPLLGPDSPFSLARAQAWSYSRRLCKNGSRR